MPTQIIRAKPTSPGRRFVVRVVNSDLHKGRPYKPLCEKLVPQSGRNNQGRITVRHRGGGHKRMYRIIDFKRDKVGVTAKVVAIEYDPNRSSRIALLQYFDGQKRYILAPQGIQVGDVLMSGPEAELRVGNALPLRNIPLGTQVHNIELNPGQGGKMVRSAGGSAQVLAKVGEQVQLRMPSGEVRIVRMDCMATIGQVGNVDHQNIAIGKAGRNRYLGKRPTVRGSVMNPRDHPHGGGEGRAPIGGQPKTPWGKPAMGYRTRHNKSTDKYIVRRRGGGR